MTIFLIEIDGSNVIIRRESRNNKLIAIAIMLHNVSINLTPSKTIRLNIDSVIYTCISIMATISLFLWEVTENLKIGGGMVIEPVHTMSRK